MAVRKAGGKSAVTDWWVEQRFGPALRPVASLLGCQLQTGRTHQVRVHLAHLGSPVVGDRVYGRNKRQTGSLAAVATFPRQALHAAVLEFSHPRTGRHMKFETEIPQDFRDLLQLLKNLT